MSTVSKKEIEDMLAFALKLRRKGEETYLVYSVMSCGQMTLDLMDKLSVSQDGELRLREALKKACSYHELGQVVSPEDDAYFKAVLSSPSQERIAKVEALENLWKAVYLCRVEVGVLGAAPILNAMKELLRLESLSTPTEVHS